MCLGVILPFLLSRAAFPASSKISAGTTSTASYSTEAEHVSHAAQCSGTNSTCQILNDCRHVDWRPHANAVLVRSSPQVPHHPAHWEDDACPRRARELGGLLLPSSGGHPVPGETHSAL